MSEHLSPGNASGLPPSPTGEPAYQPHMEQAHGATRFGTENAEFRWLLGCLAQPEIAAGGCRLAFAERAADVFDV